VEGFGSKGETRIVPKENSMEYSRDNSRDNPGKTQGKPRVHVYKQFAALKPEASRNCRITAESVAFDLGRILVEGCDQCRCAAAGRIA
jgi:hypothetical protein